MHIPFHALGNKMIKFKEFINLNERYVNLFDDDKDKRKEYAKQVWDLLQKSYRDIGGIKGSGFESIDSMIDKIKMWKLAVHDGKVEAVVMYKDREGRKSVAIASSGTPWAKEKIADMIRNDIKRSYGEKSKSALGFLLKLYPFNVLEEFLIKPDEASKILNEKVTPIKNVPKEQWPEDAKKTLEKYPQLLDYGYLRELGGSPTFKVMVGSPRQSFH